MKLTSLRQIVSALVFLLLTASFGLGGDTSVLRPPKGSRVALIVFEDMQCPQCARAAPLLHEAAQKYNIPLIQYDFPLPMHNWSFEAAVNARWFDTKSKKLGDDYRLFIFQNQPYITRDNLRGTTERFASDHGVAFPFVVDPSGELGNKVRADAQLGQRIPVTQTPTIYIVSETNSGPSAVKAADDLSQLYQQIDQAVKQAGPAPQEHKTATASKGTAKKTQAKSQ